MNKKFAYLLLILTALIWGSTFPIIKISLEYTSPFVFISLRFLVAAIVIFAIFKNNILKSDLKTLMYGLIIGISLFFGYLFQTVGLIYTTASHSGMITGLYVIMAPIIALILLKERLTLAITISILSAITGLILLTGFYESRTLNFGDFLTIFSALAYAFQVVLIDKYVKTNDVITLTFFQLIPVLVLSSFLLPFDSRVIYNQDSVFAILFTGIVATAFAIYFQVQAQKVLTSAETSIFLTSEPIFAVIFSYLLLNEGLGLISIFGAALIIASMVIISIKNNQKR